MDISIIGSIYKQNGYDGMSNTKKNRIIPSINRQRIIRTLLNHPEGNLTKYELAKLSLCNFPTTHRILKELQNQGLVEGTEVKEFKLLVKSWKSSQIKPKQRWYLIKDPIKILQNTKLQYALTTYHAENIVQNYLFPSIVDIYIHSIDTISWHKELINDGLVGKGNVRILTGDDHVFYNSFIINNLRLVSIPQLILDLLNEGGTCIEAANNLMQKVINHTLPKL
jgi:hypothetical protein